MTHRRKLNLSPAVLLVFVIGLAAFNVLRYRQYVLDDTYISLRYARNLVEGQGLVFNPGERVEGYTNFLFVLLAALFMKIGIDPVLALKWLLAGAGGGTLWLSARLERLGASGGAALPLSVVFLLPLPAFAYWSLCPMETMLFTLLLV